MRKLFKVLLVILLVCSCGVVSPAPTPTPSTEVVIPPCEKLPPEHAVFVGSLTLHQGKGLEVDGDFKSTGEMPDWTVRSADKTISLKVHVLDGVIMQVTLIKGGELTFVTSRPANCVGTLNASRAEANFSSNNEVGFYRVP